MFDRNPGADVGANETGQGRDPFRNVFVSLGLIQVVSDGYQLGSSEVIRERFTLSGGPTSCARNPGLLKWNHVVKQCQDRWRGLLRRHHMEKPSART